MEYKYYLDTNAIYALSREFEKISKLPNVAISFLGIQEILSKVNNEKEFIRRKKLIDNIKRSKIRIYMYLPIECICIAFKKDISTIDWVEKKRDELLIMMNIITQCNSYSEYQKALMGYGIEIDTILTDLKNTKKEVADGFSKIFRQNYLQIKEAQGRAIEINPKDLFMEGNGQKENREYLERFVKTIFKNLEFDYDNEDIEDWCNDYTGELTPFFIGVEFYEFKRSVRCEMAEKNDYLDINHLLYLRGEQDIIVTNDEIFDKMTIFKQRIKINDFKTLIS